MAWLWKLTEVHVRSHDSGFDRVVVAGPLQGHKPLATQVPKFKGWASSTFPSGDVMSRTPAKSQFLGKHRLPNFEIASKPSKAKQRKTTMDASEALPILCNPNVQPILKAPSDSCLRFGTTTSSMYAAVMGDFLRTSLLDMDNEVALEAGISDIVPHSYNPGFISGLEDCSLSPEFTDIG